MEVNICKACGVDRSAKGWRACSSCKSCRYARRRRKRARASVHGTHTKDDLWAIYVAQRASCLYCGVHIPYFGPKSHVDHLVPIAAGGSNSAENLVWACAKCDEDKADMLLTEWPGLPIWHTYNLRVDRWGF